MSIFIKKKFIGDDEVDGAKILVLNNQAVRSQNASGSAVELFKLDASDVLQFVQMPQVSADPTSGNHLTRKSYVDARDAAEAAARITGDAVLQAAIDAEKERAMAREAELQLEVELEEARALAAETALGEEIEAEEARAMAREAQLQAEIEEEAGVRAAADAAEAAARQAADAAEAAARAAADAAEATARIAGDAASMAYTDAEIAELKGDAGLEYDTLGKIEDKIQFIMSNTDPAAIDSLTELLAAYQAADSNVYDSISALVTSEEARALAREAELQAEIDAEETAREQADASIRHEFAAADSAVRSEFAAADQAVLNEAKAYTDESVGSVIQDVEIERQAREAEDLTFLKLDGSRPMESTLHMDGHYIAGIGSLQAPAGIDSILVQGSLDFMSNGIYTVTGLREPEQDSDAATKLYVDQQNASQNQAASAAYAALQAAIDAETARAIAAEEAETAARIAADQAEAAARQAGDAASMAYTDAEIEALKGGVSPTYNTLKKIEDKIEFIVENTDPAALDSLAEIVSAFQAADGSIFAAINALAASAAANLHAEEAARIAADEAEAAARQAADEAEAAARSAADAALQAEIDAIEASVAAFQPAAPEVFSLSASDIANQYIELAVSAVVANSVEVRVNRLFALPSEFVQSSGTAGKVRLSFAGALASGGQQALVAGDTLVVRYWVE